MKKIFYLILFVLCTFLLVGCDETKGRTFKLQLIEEPALLREKIVFDVELIDPDKQLNKSEVKGTIAKKGTDDKKTQTLSFDSNNTDEVTFSSLTPDTVYTVEFYTSYNGKIVSLIKDDYKTSNEGTLENPYKVANYADLKKVNKERTGHFKLTADIDCGNESFSPLFQTAFTGTFDGAKEDGGCYKISNFTFATVTTDEETKVKTYSHKASKDQYFGLFGNIGEGAKISNLELNAFNVHVSRDTYRNSGTYGSTTYYYGLLAGVCAGEIENIKVTDSSLNVKSENTNQRVFKVGGLVGNLKGKGTIKNVELDLDINVESKYDISVGGVVGTTRDAEVFTEKVDGVTKDVYNIFNANFVGSINVTLKGHNSTKLISDDIYSSQTAVGGLVGKNVAALIKDCNANAAIKVTSKFETNEGQSIFVGGLVGKNISDNSKVDNCVANVSFEVETFDIPKEENKLNIYVGLFAGQNGGDQGGSSKVSNCTFAPKAECVVNVYDSENVNCHFDKVANVMKESILENSTLAEGTTSVTLTVKKYTKAEGSDEYTESTTASLTVNN